MQLLHRPVLWVAGAVQFVRLALVHAVRFWLPTFLVVDRGFSLQMAGVVVAIGALVTAPANIVGGYVSDRLSRPLLVVGVSLAVLATTSLLLTAVSSVWLIIVIVAVKSLFIQVYFGPLFEVPIRVLGSHSAGAINGFSNFCANLGGLTFAYTLGAVREATGSFAIGFYSLSAMCVLGLVATGALSRMSRSDSDTRTEAERSNPGTA